MMKVDEMMMMMKRSERRNEMEKWRKGRGVKIDMTNRKKGRTNRKSRGMGSVENTSAQVGLVHQ